MRGAFFCVAYYNPAMANKAILGNGVEINGVVHTENVLRIKITGPQNDVIVIKAAGAGKVHRFTSGVLQGSQTRSPLIFKSDGTEFWDFFPGNLEQTVFPLNPNGWAESKPGGNVSLSTPDTRPLDVWSIQLRYVTHKVEP